MQQDMGALSGSREPNPQAVSALPGFDPERIARKLTAPQADELCRHTAAFSPPFNARRARALWEGIKPSGEQPLFLLQKEFGATRYRLSPQGVSVKGVLRGVSRDVRRLVVAARAVAYEPCDAGSLAELDAAAEAFAADVPWEDEPANAIEAGTAATAETGAVHESAVRQDAPNSLSHSSDGQAQEERENER